MAGGRSLPGAGEAADQPRYESFLAHFSRCQMQMTGFIRSLVHDQAAADDVFQSTSLTLWRRFHTFREEQPFLPWALGIARHEVLHYWRSRRRDRLVFGEAVLSQLADAAATFAEESPPRQQAMEACIQSLTDRQRSLIDMFYGQRMPADRIAASWGRSVHAVYKALKVVRRGLLECVERRLAADT